MKSFVLSFAVALLTISIFDSGQGKQAYVPAFLRSQYDPINNSSSSVSATKTATKTAVKGGVKVGGASATGSISAGPSGIGGAFSAGLGAMGNPIQSGIKTVANTVTSGLGALQAGFSAGTGQLPSMSFASQGCPSMPRAPLNSEVSCVQSQGCKVTCMNNYRFPTGEKELLLVCKSGNWEPPGYQWPGSLPNCEPICSPPCLNNGICVSPDKCNCPDNFSGPQCQYETKPCLDRPPLPMNSRRICRATSCTITCMEGFEFPDGSQIADMVCKDGSWIPSLNKWASIPDCKPTCKPPCQNGGQCLSLNVCQCPTGWKGPQCQFPEANCDPKKLQFNGGYNCSGDFDSFSCSVSCPGVPFEYAPAPKYTCYYATGQFLPAPIPQCHYPNMYTPHFGGAQAQFPNELYPGKIDYQPPVEPIVTFNTTPTLEGLRPQGGSCFTWGGAHYKTFDSKVYSVASKCAHALVRDVKDNTFAIVVKDSKECDTIPEKCHKIIKIYLQDKEYVLQLSADGTPTFSSGSKLLPLPGRVPGIRAEMSAHYVIINLDSIGAKLKWDGQLLIQVEVGSNLWRRTGGMCGILDGNPVNDLLTQDGFLPQNLATFATSWKVDSLKERCDELPNEQNACAAFQQSPKAMNALNFCRKLLSDPKFVACHSVMDEAVLLDACQWDYCSCKRLDPQICACETMNVYVRECAHKGIKTMVNWRDQQTCPMKCTGGRVYKACGPSTGQAVCGGATEKVDEIGAPCEEGCYCPEGTVLYGSQCITEDKCPCRLRGKDFPPGTNVPKDCNTCTCSNGKWICTEVSCGARCSAVGDPHYLTFDGKQYDFMGQCSYYLMKHDNFTIEAENTACAGSISLAMNFPVSVSSGMPSCTKAVTIKMGGQTVKLNQNQGVVVNGQEVTKLPYSIGGIDIRSASSIFLLVDLPNGIEVWWDGVTRAYIDVPATFKGSTKGLCGTFDNNQKNDFLTPEGDIEQSVVQFANKWKTKETCKDTPDNFKAHPCDINIQNKLIAEEQCKKIKSDLFSNCHAFVDPDEFYHNCVFDMCSCATKMSNCLCPMIASYAQECARQGVKIDWRNEIRECGVHCPGGQKYQVCGNSCTRTCSDISSRPNCKTQCVEGCNCPEGQALDEHGECIPIGQCKCQYEGLEFFPEYKEVRHTKLGMELCTCRNAMWSCRTADLKEYEQYPQANQLKERCSSTKNMQFTTCESVAPRTCKNMHNFEPVTSAVCHAGCECKPGYVLDAFLKTCVRPTECSCHHGGRSYSENAIVQNDCNSCTCKGGKWICSEKQCWGECSAWGDSHYKTFDGKSYDYQGQCDYVLAKGAVGNDETFDISIQNVPCGSLGVSCSKSITVKVGRGAQQEVFALTREKELAPHEMLKRMNVRELGHFVIVEVPEMGVIVHWDKGTRVYVRLDPMWKTKTKGLCGNYNDNQMDDFQTPSGGLAEASAQLFGDSWRLQSYCPPALEIKDTCEERPDRKVWALRKCGLLKSAPFSSCHSEVPVDGHFERCVFDACACDQGGDCECLCTALAAYAQECNNRGVAIRWRTPDLCPMQCDERCARYTPCISTCPMETCDNLLYHKQLSKMCQSDTCVEGCEAKPCQQGFVYSNSSMLECVPKDKCRVVCMEVDGVIYYEGDKMGGDECQTCHCSRGHKSCQGQPCPKPIGDGFECKSGWTDWINVNPQLEGLPMKMDDMEPLPNSVLLNQLNGDWGKCSPEQMVDIECRTVVGHTPAKETGLDAQCSLEKGLICLGSPSRVCGDMEIRVKCKCPEHVAQTLPESVVLCDVSKPLTEHSADCRAFMQCVPGDSGLPQYVEKSCGAHMLFNPVSQICDHPPNVIAIKPVCKDYWRQTTAVPLPETTTAAEELTTETGPKCPPGQEYQECAVECRRLCLNYLYEEKERGLCLTNQRCEAGCGYASKHLSCPPGLFFINNSTCVKVEDCMCVSSDGKPVKPGTVYKESPCELCQCLDNVYVCDKSACQQELETLPPDFIVEAGPIEQIPVDNQMALLPPITPPRACEKDNFKEIIDGDFPLSDAAFSASSVLGDAFSPKNARFKNTGLKSGGSWTPEIATKNQYLQINLGRQEPIYGAVIKGSPLYDEYVTSYYVLYSSDGTRFGYVTDKERAPLLFRGSVDSNTPVKQMFEVPFEANFIRVNPQTWVNNIALRVELIGCNKLKPVTAKPEVTTLPPAGKIIPNLCEDPLGVDSGMMSDQQITLSSSRPGAGKDGLKLSKPSAWKPFTNSPTEWVQFDFLEPRNITGFTTKGGPTGWVTAFNVKYSSNGKDWNPVWDGEKKDDKLFLGNFDKNTPHTNEFVLPIQTRYLRIFPIKWQDNIEMRLEPIGCYKPYPTVKEEFTTTPMTPTKCNLCPGSPSTELELGACHCKDETWWDGKDCVSRGQCPCIVNGLAYSVGTSFQSDDCSQCICKLGGITTCSKKVCDTKCPYNSRSVLTSNCACICKECEVGKRLCLTSNICINETLWCNGVKDCPDDEDLSCDEPEEEARMLAPSEIQQTRKAALCSTPTCGEGYNLRLINQGSQDTMMSSPVYQDQSKTYVSNKGGTKGGTKGGVKGGIKPPLLPKPEFRPENATATATCPVFKCEPLPPPFPGKCPPVTCPPNYLIEYDVYDLRRKNVGVCPKFDCKPPPPPDSVCNITGKSFNTFDKVQYEYQICNHVLARDLMNFEWLIALKKNCEKEYCTRDLIIYHKDHTFVIHPDFSIYYDGYNYTVEQTKKIGSQAHSFSLTPLGDKLLFVSNEFGFWIIWDKQGDVKLGVSHKLKTKVDGLCGYFNNKPEDDKRKPDGFQAKSTADFGDSWAQSDQEECEVKKCPKKLMNMAWHMCNKVKDQTLSACGQHIDLDVFVSRCVENTCNCLQAAEGDSDNEDKCRCQTLEKFVVDCLSSSPDMELSDWRAQHDCPIKCEAPLVHHDCYRRRCEPSCHSILDPNACPKVPNICFPGCFCPSGYVREGNNCVLPSSCRDCECNVLPHLQYVTYDESNFTVNGNCVYVMSRDAVAEKDADHKFQVLITNHPCSEGANKMCVGKVTILYDGHKIHVIKDAKNKKLLMLVDMERVTDFKEIKEWAAVEETAVKHLKILLKKIQVRISVYNPSLGVSIKAPSLKYSGKLEGLCGNCDGIKENDVKTPKGKEPKDIDDFALSWLYQKLPGGQNEDQCKNQDEPKCLSVPPNENPCLQLHDINRFGQCHPLLSPALFSEWCQKDICTGKLEMACESIQQYAQECGHFGFCIDWRSKICPAKKCPPGLEYKSCGPPCAATCDMIRKYGGNKCKSAPVEGCYCPEGLVLLNDTCVKENHCEVCDKEGHHDGEVWKKDSCTTCTCEGTNVKCETQTCPSIETICQQGFNVVKVPTDADACCPKYICVPAATVSPTCEPPQKPLCSSGQIMKMITDPSGCQQLICQCKPIEECDSVESATLPPLEPGMVRVVNNSGCCPFLEEVCKPDLCPKAPACPPHHNINKTHPADKCCPMYSCRVPDDKCLVDLQYTPSKTGGEQIRTDSDKQQVLKEVNSVWKDGPCRDCRCVKGPKGNYAACNVTTCPSMSSSADAEDYVLEPEAVFNQCCPKVKRVGCIHNGKKYKVGEEWPLNQEDFCTKLKCIEGLNGIQKEKQITTCDTKCEPGWQYKPAGNHSKQCCGSCQPVACVVNGLEHNVDEKWTSEDFCNNYVCLNVNGSLVVQKSTTNCSAPPPELQKDYIFESVPVKGKCCKEHKVIACKVGNIQYNIGENWPSPDGDKCKKVTCVQNSEGEIMKQELFEKCQTDCAKGWKYKESKTQCCGECVPVACVVGEEIKMPGDIWYSADKCTTYTCEPSNDQYSVSAQMESCPKIDDCPEENVYAVGCCKHCNVTSQSQVQCLTEKKHPNKTIGLVKTLRPPHGQCVNKSPINGFTECVGTCHSGTTYNSKLGQHESVCTCCQAVRFEPITIKLDCEDGYQFIRQIAVPSKCSCEGCTVSPTKQGIKTVKTG